MARQSLELARLFYTVEADTKGFERDLDSAQRSAIRFTEYIIAHPVVAAGALGAALIGVGLKATAMAAETDQAVRRIAAVLPSAIGKFAELKKAVDDIARSSGISEEALLGAAEAIAKGGAESLPDLINRLKAVQVAADATGIDMQTLAQELDQVLHVFGLSGDQIEVVAAKLKAAAQGKVAISDLLEAFRTSAPAVREAGVDFDTAAAALTKLVGEGLNAKQAASALKALAAEGGQAVRDFAGPAQDATQALKDLHAAATVVADGAQRNGDRIRENLNATMRQLGDELLPVVNAGLKATNFLLEQMAGTITRLPNQVNLATAIAQGLTGGPATTGAGGGRTPFNHGGPVVLPEITATIDPARVKAAADFEAESLKVIKALQDHLKGAAVAALDDFVAEYRKLAGTLTEEENQRALAAIASLRAQVLLEQKTPDKLITQPDTIGIRAEGLDRLDQTLEDAALHQKDLAEAAEREQRAREKSLQDARNLGRQIEQMARGAIGLAQALGLADSASAAVLQNVVSLAGALPDAIKGLEALNSGGADLKAIGGIGGALAPILGVVGGIAGLIAGLTAEDPNVKLLRDEEVKLRLAVDNLAKHFDSFAINLTGTEQGKAGGAVQELLSGHALAGDTSFHGLGSFLSGGSANGINLTDLQKVAKEVLGQELDTSNTERFIAGLRALQDALQNADRIRFMDSFTGQLDALNARFQLLNITDPVEKLKEIMAVLTDVPRQVKVTNPDGSTKLVDVGHGSPAIANALAGLDLANAGDRKKAQDKLDELLQELVNGQIDAAGLGGLTAEQFKQELLDVGGLLRDANAQVGSSSSFSVDRTITEITGSRIAAILDTSLVYQSTLPEIRDLLAAAFGGALITPPVLPVSQTAAGPSIIVQAGAFPLTVVVPPGADGQAIGQAAAAAQAQALDQLLAQRAGLKQTAAGGVVQ